MPKKEIDYSNTVIYKITCKNLNIKDIYVGHTTNFVQRKHTHKQSCNNIKNINYKCKLYKIIREKGGWDNWNMSMVDFIHCANSIEARQKEQEYYEKLNANLNSVEPFIIKEDKPIIIKPLVEKKIYYCEICNIYTPTQKQLLNHYATSKHKKGKINNFDNSKSSSQFYCEYCDYSTCRLSQYNRHILTDKHLRIINDNEKVQKQHFECNCGKKYKYDSGLSRHKKTCQHNMELSELKLEPNINDKEDLHELVIKLLTDNQEMKKENQKLIHTITDLLPKIGNTTISHNTNNVKHKFNINLFLNEKCKDALTMNEFVDKIEISMKNLLTTKDKGLGEGLSNIIIDNMNKLSLYERPIHCTDKKRETLYVKNEEWEKDDKNEQINKLLKNVEKKQMRNINKWIDEHPNYMDSELLQEQYINLIKGCTSSIDDCKDKVIRKVCDNVYLTEKN